MLRQHLFETNAIILIPSRQVARGNSIDESTAFNCGSAGTTNDRRLWFPPSHFSLLTSHSRASGLTRVVLLLDLELDLIPHRLDLPHLALCPPGFVALLTE